MSRARVLAPTMVSYIVRRYLNGDVAGANLHATRAAAAACADRWGQSGEGRTAEVVEIVQKRRLRSAGSRGEGGERGRQNGSSSLDQQDVNAGRDE